MSARTAGLAPLGRVLKSVGLAPLGRVVKLAGLAPLGRVLKSAGSAPLGRVLKSAGLAPLGRVLKSAGLAPLGQKGITAKAPSPRPKRTGEGCEVLRDQFANAEIKPRKSSLRHPLKRMPPPSGREA